MKVRKIYLACAEIQNNLQKVFLGGLVSLILFFSANAQVFEVDTIIYNGNPDKRINIVFLSDGFQKNELDSYIDNAHTIASKLFAQQPFEQYTNYFNVFAIRVPSNVSGAALDPSKPIDNYFGSTFNYAGIDRLLFPVNSARVYSVLASNFPQYDLACMIVNSTKYGGSGGFPATTSIEASSAEIAFHEIGHSFVGLKDEYWVGPEYASEGINMTKISDKQRIKWKNWLGVEGIGIYPYQEDPTWFKPHKNCKMQFLGVPFCAVCREAFIETFFKKSSPVDSYSPATASNTGAGQTFTLKLVSPDPNTIKILWRLNSSVIGENTNQFKDENLTGNNTLLVKVVDTTLLYKQPRIYEHFVKWTITNNSVESKDSTAINTSSNIITEIEMEDEPKLQMSAYPNPVAEKTTLNIKGIVSQDIRVSVFDNQGRKLELPLDQTQDGFHSIDFSRQRSGVYIIVLETASATFRTKIIKQ